VFIAFAKAGRVQFSGTAAQQQDERDDDADVACLLETVKFDTQVLLH